MKLELLDNIAWHALSGAQIEFSMGNSKARRYVSGLPPIIAFASEDAPDFASLSEYCSSGERLYYGGRVGVIPSGWKVLGAMVGNQMLWDTKVLPIAEEKLNIIHLNASHFSKILDLVEATDPGPFGENLTNLGDYFGVFEGDQLIAMAGERLFAGGFREIGGVCTLPKFRGQGLASRLTKHLIRRQMQRGEIPFLHVRQDNIVANRIYQNMGFQFRQTIPFNLLMRK